MIDLFAYLGGIFGMISLFPQIFKSLKTGSTADLAWLMLITTFLSVLAYEVYAMGLGLVPVVIMNGIFVLSVLVMIIIKYIFDVRRSEPVPDLT